VKGFGALPLVGQGFFFNPQWRKYLTVMIVTLRCQRLRIFLPYDKSIFLKRQSAFNGGKHD
jgi:hypothetical protein